MPLDAQAYKNAAYPPMLQRQKDEPEVQRVLGFRRFILRWTSHKAIGSRRRQDEWQECQGVLFSDHNAISRIALSNGQQFATQSEMEDVVKLGGFCQVDWLDEE